MKSWDSEPDAGPTARKTGDLQKNRKLVAASLVALQQDLVRARKPGLTRCQVNVTEWGVMSGVFEMRVHWWQHLRGMDSLCRKATV